MPPAAVQHPLPGPSELDRAVRTVLARPEFAERELPGLLQWLADLYAAAREALWRGILELDALREAAPVLGWLVIGLLAAFLAAGLAHLAVTAARAWRSRDRSRGPAGEEAPARAATEARGPAVWEGRAGREATAGRPRAAALSLYRAVLLRLDERGALSYDPSKTPGDYRRETAAAAEGGALRAFLRLFEPIAFGGRAVTDDAYAGLVSAAREAGARV